MKGTDKKSSGFTHIDKPAQDPKPVKQTSGDKKFDKAIDRLFKPIAQPAVK